MSDTEVVSRNRRVSAKDRQCEDCRRLIMQGEEFERFWCETLGRKRATVRCVYCAEESARC